MAACPCSSIVIFILVQLSYISINEMLYLFKEGSQKVIQLPSVDNTLAQSELRFQNVSETLYGCLDCGNHLLLINGSENTFTWRCDSWINNPLLSSRWFPHHPPADYHYAEYTDELQLDDLPVAG
jgi:hypothetical protein